MKCGKALMIDFGSQLKVVINSWDSFYLIPVKDILFCEEESGYTKFHLVSQECIPGSGSLNKYENMLCKNGFFRIHQNYLVNLQHITSFEDDSDCNVILDYQYRITAESLRRLELLEKLNRMVTCRKI